MAFVAACKSELAVPDSFAAVMEEYFKLNNIPAIKYPKPDSRVVEYYANEAKRVL